jgi:signal transduction histidine kinase/CheY-like chemotaxis protein
MASRSDEPGGAAVDAAQAARLRQFIVVDTAVDLAASASMVLLYGLYRAPALLYLAAATGAYALLMVWAWRRVERGDLEGSVTVISIGVWFIALAVAYFAPMMLPLQPAIALVAVAVGLPYAGRGRMLRLIAGSVLVLLASSALSVTRPDPFGVRAAVPGWAFDAILVVFLPAATGLVLLMLWQYGNRLNDALAQVREANAALRDSERSLEAKVVERTAELAAKNAALHRSELDLSRARDEALAASRAKSTFLAGMSHELRTPLNAIIGYSEMLEEEAEERDAGWLRGDLQKIVGAGRHLLDLINAVLDLSKIEAGKMELHLETFEVRAVAGEVLSVVRPLAARRGNRLSLSCPEGVGAMHADRTKVRQVLLNLLGNACKFTQDGLIELSVAREASAGRDWLRFDVADTGIGMAPEQVGRLFSDFAQAEGSTATRFGGTGLGLALSRRFCRLMGGEVVARSRPGEGSTFTVTLPAEVPAEAQSDDAPPARAAEPSDGAGTVLVIDDDPAARDLLGRALSREGFRVVAAASGAEGLRQARELRPDTITLDVLMPGLDGWAVLSRLKADPALAGIPVVMLTVTDDAPRGLAMGADAYLAKPVDRERLAAVFGQYRRDRAPAPAAGTGAEYPATDRGRG